ncbi:MAG TPA: GAF domain-containing sensor histidine kinase [Candidatus Limnocylindrales bacterium]
MTVPLRRPRRTGIWLLAFVSIAASLAALGVRAVRPTDGATVPFYADAWSADAVRVDVADPAPGGLASGDEITGVAGRPLAGWIDSVLDPNLDRTAATAGTTTYSVRRDGRPLDVAVALQPHDVSATLRDFWSALVFTAVFQVVALYVLWRRPEASAAVALTVAAAGVTGSTLPWLLGLEVSDITQGWPFVLYGLTAGGIYMILWPAGALHLPLAMSGSPSGPSRRQLALAYGVPLGAYVICLAAARVTAPSSVAWLGSWPTIQTIVIIPTILVGIALSIRGYRSAMPAVREQIRWAAVGGAGSAVASLVLLLGPQLVTGRPIVPWSAVGLLALPLPLGLAASILRYRLFDIDVAINRTLVYGGATVALVAIYAASVSILGTFLRQEGGFPASLLATGLAAVVALPIRDQLQRTVNRLMYGDRDDPYRAMTRLGQRLEATLDPIEAPQVIVRTVAESMRVPWVALRLGPEGNARMIAHGRRPPGKPIEVPLAYGAEVVGALLVAPRSSAEPLSGADRQLLEALARQAGAVVHALTLTLDLIASRERLVAAREEERRRIRRDLHDGLGPTLAAIGMRAEVAADIAGRDPVGAAQVLGELRLEVQSALADIRRLVDALRPPALDELGLVGALEAQADRLGNEPLVDVASSGPMVDLPAAIEVAAYRIAVEAMTNAVRHARAKSCTVRLSEADWDGTDPAAGRIDVPARGLEVEVTDDGRGLPSQPRHGIGLVSMRERAAEVGGSCVIESVAGGGTRVFARLPLDGLGSP